MIAAQAARLAECPDCGLLQRTGELSPGEAAVCPRCGGEVLRRKIDSVNRVRAFSLAGLIFYWWAVGARRRRSWLSPVWLVPSVSAVLVGWVVWDRIIEAGPTIQISFREGQGVTAKKTDLRYRGVKMGEVSKIELSQDLSRVLVSVELERTAADLAKKGSQFWIVRPQVSAQDGTPIFYKGVQVGAAAETVLSDDARQVRTRVVMERAYNPLIRQGSKF